MVAGKQQRAKASRCLRPRTRHQSAQRVMSSASTKSVPDDNNIDSHQILNKTREGSWSLEDDTKFRKACVEMIEKKYIMQRQGALTEENLKMLLKNTFPDRTKKNLENKWRSEKEIYDKHCENVKLQDPKELRRKIQKASKKFQILLEGPPPNIDLLEIMFEKIPEPSSEDESKADDGYGISNSVDKLHRDVHDYAKFQNAPSTMDHEDEHTSKFSTPSPKQATVDIEVSSDQDTSHQESAERRSNERQDQQESGSAHANENDLSTIPNKNNDVSVEARTSLDNSVDRDDLQRKIVRPPVNLLVFEGDCLDSEASELDSYLLATCDFYGDFLLLDPCDAPAVFESRQGKCSEFWDSSGELCSWKERAKRHDEDEALKGDDYEVDREEHNGADSSEDTSASRLAKSKIGGDEDKKGDKEDIGVEACSPKQMSCLKNAGCRTPFGDITNTTSSNVAINNTNGGPDTSSTHIVDSKAKKRKYQRRNGTGDPHPMKTRRRLANESSNNQEAYWSNYDVLPRKPKKAQWCPEDETKLCNVCVEMIEDGNMHIREGTLTMDKLKTLRKRLRAETRNRYKPIQLLGKWNSLKKLYDGYEKQKKLKNAKKFRKRMKNAAKVFKNLIHAPPGNYELLKMIFGRTLSTHSPKMMASLSPSSEPSLKQAREEILEKPDKTPEALRPGPTAKSPRVAATTSAEPSVRSPPPAPKARRADINIQNSSRDPIVVDKVVALSDSTHIHFTSADESVASMQGTTSPKRKVLELSVSTESRQRQEVKMVQPENDPSTIPNEIYDVPGGDEDKERDRDHIGVNPLSEQHWCTEAYSPKQDAEALEQATSVSDDNVSLRLRLTELEGEVSDIRRRNDSLSKRNEELIEELSTVHLARTSTETELFALRDQFKGLGLAAFNTMEALHEALGGLGVVVPAVGHSSEACLQSLARIESAASIMTTAARTYGDHCAETSWRGAFGLLHSAGCENLASVEEEIKKIPTELDAFVDMAKQSPVRKPSSIFRCQFWEPSGQNIALASARSSQNVPTGSTAPPVAKD